MTMPLQTRPGRILMTADAVGGVWRYAMELAGGLAAEEIEVVLAVMGPSPSPAQQREAAAIPGLVLRHKPFKLEWMPAAERDLEKAADWLLDLEARHAPDLIHVNGFAQTALPWRVPALLVAHSCVESWWRAVHGHSAPAAWAPYRARVRRGIDAAAQVIAPTRAFLAELKEIYGPFLHGRAIWNGLEGAPHRGGEKEPIVLAAGRVWDEAKNIHILSQVAANVAWPIHVAGDVVAPDGAPTRRGDGLHHLGRLEAAEMQDWYRRASIFIAPARYEPFGLGILEAALAGCALVLGDIPTLRELWGRAAVLVPSDDPDAMERALQEVSGEAGLASALGRMAQRHAGQYSRRWMVEGYLASYHEVLLNSLAATGSAERAFAVRATAAE